MSIDITNTIIKCLTTDKHLKVVQHKLNSLGSIDNNVVSIVPLGGRGAVDLVFGTMPSVMTVNYLIENYIRAEPDQNILQLIGTNSQRIFRALNECSDLQNLQFGSYDYAFDKEEHDLAYGAYRFSVEEQIVTIEEEK